VWQALQRVGDRTEFYDPLFIIASPTSAVQWLTAETIREPKNHSKTAIDIEPAFVRPQGQSATLHGAALE